MAGAYQTTASGDIGSLLRLIQDEKASGILNAPPATDPGSPIREVVSEPIKAPEAPGSSQVVSLRPEQGAPAGPDGTSPAVVAPIAPVASVAAPVAPTPAPTPGPRISSPAASPSTLNASRTSSTPSLGTKITTSVAPKATAIKTVSSKPSAAPKPAPVASKTPQKSSFGSVGIGGTVAKIGTKIAPDILGAAAKGLVKATGGGLLDVGGYIKALDNILKGKSAPKKSVNA